MGSIPQKQSVNTTENPLLAGRVDLGAILKDGIDPPDELEPDILLKGKIHHIFGPSESGKTIIALAVIKRRIEAHQYVVVFDAENGTRTIAERLKQMGADPELVSEYLVYLPFPHLTMEAHSRRAFADLLDEIEPVLVVFDSWASFLSSAGLSENENSEVEDWDTAFSKVAKMRSIASVIIDHTPHEHDRSRGAARKREVADVQWFVKKTMDFNRDVVGEAVLINKKDREGWLPGSVRFSIGGSDARLTCERTEGTIETADPVSGLTPSERKVFDTLREEFPRGARIGEWQRATRGRGVSRATHYRAVSKLVSFSLTHIPLVSSVNETYFVNETPNPGKGDETGESRIDTPNEAKSHLVSNRSHETNETGGIGQSLNSLPPFKGGDVRPTPETTPQAEHNSDGQPSKRHVGGSPNSAQKAAREGKGVVQTQPDNPSLSANGATAPQSAEQVQPENDACRIEGDDTLRTEDQVFAEVDAVLKGHERQRAKAS